MSAALLPFAAGFTAGILTACAAIYLLRREFDLYRRVTGRTLDFTHRSRS